MVTGMGLDIMELERIAGLWDKYGLRFAERILHPAELELLPERPVNFLAGRFAAKEAAAKALGTGFSQGIGPRDFCALPGLAGQPLLSFHNAALKRLQALGAAKAHLSISHSRDTVAAVVILEA